MTLIDRLTTRQWLVAIDKSRLRQDNKMVWYKNALASGVFIFGCWPRTCL